MFGSLDPSTIVIAIALALGLAAAVLTLAGFSTRRPWTLLAAGVLAGAALAGALLAAYVGPDEIISGENRVHFKEQYVHRFSDDRTTICIGDEPDEVATTGTCLAFAADREDLSSLRPGDRILAGWVDVSPPIGPGGGYLVSVEPLG